MLYACFAVVAVFIIFIVTTFFVTKKNYTFNVDKKVVRLSNVGGTFKIFIDNKLIANYHMPQLIKGETFKINVNEKEIEIKCKSNGFGTKRSVKAFDGTTEIYNNGIEIKEKSKKPKR